MKVKDMVTAAAAKSGAKGPVARKAVEATLEQIGAALDSGEERIKIPGLGVFITKRAAEGDKPARVLFRRRLGGKKSDAPAA
jgi:nucleoid DNA-binding protein